MGKGGEWRAGAQDGWPTGDLSLPPSPPCKTMTTSDDPPLKPPFGCRLGTLLTPSLPKAVKHIRPSLRPDPSLLLLLLVASIVSATLIHTPPPPLPSHRFPLCPTALLPLPHLPYCPSHHPRPPPTRELGYIWAKVECHSSGSPSPWTDGVVPVAVL